MLPQPSEKSWESDHKGKLKRQRAILDAARAIIVKSGAASLRMRDVAERAGVSIATPYNLFGSKAAILQAIYDEETVSFNEDFGRRASLDPIVKLFELVDFTFSYYKRSPEFYRQIINLLYRDPNSDFVVRASKPQIAYISDLFADAVAQGELRSDAPVALISVLFTRAFISICQDWLDGALTLSEARSQVRDGLILFLEGAIVPHAQAKLAKIKSRIHGRRRRPG